jgi:hypothetical protein
MTYVEAVILTKFVQVEDHLALDIPCQLYHYTIKSLGKDVTYAWNDLKNKDLEVLAYVHVKDSDEEVVKKHKGYIGNTWETVKDDARYIKHFPITKEDYLAKTVIDKDTLAETVVKYAEADKAERVPMYPCMLKTDYVKPLSVITAEAVEKEASENEIKEVVK